MSFKEEEFVKVDRHIATDEGRQTPSDEKRSLDPVEKQVWCINL